MRVTLHVVAGPQTGREFTFDQHDTFMIGRSEDAQFCLPHDRFFSRHHCILEIAPPQCFLRDLGSTNGSFVNGIRVETAHLKHGDRIQGGETVLEVKVISDVPSLSNSGSALNEKTEPSVITVACLNCGLPSKAEASRPDAKLSYVCEACREKLRQNPQPIPNYQMIRILGQGGMGSVMLARSVRDGELVAIKRLAAKLQLVNNRLNAYARDRGTAALLHQNVVSYSNTVHNGIVYLVSEYVSGMDASRLAKKRGGKLNYLEVVKIIEQTLAALDFAHQKGFVHRDIKEQNILVDGNYPNYLAKLTDFGLSKSYKQTGMSGVTMVGDVAGTIAYMPPEQVRDFKEVRPPSDIYALGMTAYSLLTGAHALDIGPTAGISETVKAIFEKPIIPISRRVPEVPIRVAAVIETALAKQADLRWSSAGEMREALIRAASQG